MTGAGKIIDRFLVSLGFVADTKGLDDFKRRAEEATHSLVAIGSVVTGVLAGVAAKTIAHLGSEMEQNRIQIAGFLSALDIVEGADPTAKFNAGLTEADATIQEIVKAAAELPGEANEYIDVFKSGLSYVKGAMPGGSLAEMRKFLIDLTAVGKSVAPNLDSGRLAVDLSDMLASGKGVARGMMPLMKGMLPLMKEVEGFKDLDVHKFNQLGAPERLKLMQAAIVRMGPMLEAQKDSWEAIEGSVKSTIKMLTLKATVPLFKGMKAALVYINKLLVNQDGSFTKLGTTIIGFGERAGRAIQQAARAVGALVEKLATSETVLKLVAIAAAGLGIALVGMAIGRAVNGVVMLVTALANLKRLFTGVLAVAIGLIAEDLYVFSQGGESVTGMLVDKLGPAGEYISKVVMVGLAVAMAYVNREAVAMGIALVRPLAPLIGIGLAAYFVVKAWKAFGEKGKAAMVFVGTAAAALFLYLQRAAIQTAIGIALMNLPLILITASLVALAGWVYYIANGWRDFSAEGKTAVAVVSAAIGTLIAAFVATQAASIAAAAASFIAWVVALGPISLMVAAVGVLGVALYELVKHWDAVTDAVSRMADKVTSLIPGLGAVNQLFRDLGIIKEETTDERNKRMMLPSGGGVTAPGSDQRFDSGGPVRGAWQSPYAASAPGSERDRRTAEGPSALAGEGSKGAIAAAKDMLKRFVGGGDLTSFLGGSSPLTAGGLPQILLPRGSDTTTTVTNKHETKFGDIKVDARGNSDPDRVGRDVADAIERQIRNTQGGSRY